jgi:blue copper oxidase
MRASLGAAAGLGLGRSAWGAPPTRAAAPTARDADIDATVDVEVALRAIPGEVMLDPSGRRATRVWRYEGRLIKGLSDALTPAAAGYLGPMFRIRQGQRVRVNFENQLPEESVVHFHGLDVAEANDGHPRLAVGPGGTRRSDFQVTNRPGTYWYHPHPHRRTGAQVYAGMAGLFVVADGDDTARGLPAAPFDLPLVIQDRVIDADWQLVYRPNPMLGFLGDRIFVNGQASPTLPVAKGSYRLRVLNGSNARIYKLAFSDGRPMIAIGSDGGLLAAPLSRPYLMLAPGERVEIWVDFGNDAGSADVALESRAFEAPGMMGGMGGMGGMGMMGGGGGKAPLANGAPVRLCQFAVRGPGDRLRLPRRLDPPAFRPAAEVKNARAPRQFQVSMAMMRWGLNGRSFEMSAVAPDEHIKLGATEDWVFSNLGGMMGMPHPIHIHGGQFQIVERDLAGDAAGDMSEGLINNGWKDTVLLRAGERVRLRVRFARHAGLFLYHCHNLEHEDMGMMRNFRVDA